MTTFGDLLKAKQNAEADANQMRKNLRNVEARLVQIQNDQCGCLGGMVSSLVEDLAKYDVPSTFT